MANVLDEAMKRPLPTLGQWLDEKADGKRSADFDELTALYDLAVRTVLTSDQGLPIEQACFLRLWKGFLIASVELCNLELAAKVPSEIYLTMLPRVMATAAIYAVASVAPPDTGFRDVAKLFTEEFRAAAKTAADGLMEEL